MLPLSGGDTIWYLHMFCIRLLLYDAIFCILRGSGDAAADFYFIARVNTNYSVQSSLSGLKRPLMEASVEKCFSSSDEVSSSCSEKIRDLFIWELGNCFVEKLR